MKTTLVLLFSFALVTCATQPAKVTSSGKWGKFRRAPMTHARKPASLKAQIANLDPKKPTVCTATFNSVEERETFAAALPNFNFIELINPDDLEDMYGMEPPVGDSWFAQSCRPKLSCDILVVSGHFAGDFFSESGPLSLSMEKLEELSCQKRCDGILKAPKEVFLFGCNTLGGKDQGSRTQQEYIQVLRQHNYSEHDAQVIAAFRYSPIGTSFANRMERVFSHSKIYGFNEISPSGVNVKGLLQNYFKSIPNYEKHLKNLKKNADNKAWRQSMKVTTAVQTSGQESASTAGICLLYDSSKPDFQKVDWVSRVISSEKSALENLPGLALYMERDLYKTEQEPNPVKFDGILNFERQLKNKISKNQVARNIFEKYIAMKDSSLLAIQASMISVGGYLGWYSPAQMFQMRRNLLGKIKGPISEAQAAFVCEYKIEIPTLKVSDLNPGKYSAYDIYAISCLKPRDPEVVLKLSQYLADPDFGYSSLYAMSEIQIYDPRVTKKVLAMVEADWNNFQQYKPEFIQYLSRSTPLDPAVFQLLSSPELVGDESLGAGEQFITEYSISNGLTDEATLQRVLMALGESSLSADYVFRVRDYIAKQWPCQYLHRLQEAEEQWQTSSEAWVVPYHQGPGENAQNWDYRSTTDFNQVRLSPTVLKRCSRK